MTSKTKKLKTFLKYFAIIFFAVFLLPILIIYILSPVYDYPEPKQFSGDKILNPYQNIDTAHWRKANFQLHTDTWGILANGRNNTSEVVYEAYKKLGYDVVSVSDYQSINNFISTDSTYIPVYEHGMNILKNHQLVLGAEKVLWLDYPIFQTLNNKQHILYELRKSNGLTALSHPGLLDAYSESDMAMLGNYDFVEVLNNLQISEKQWDAALSSGHKVYILADDDCHDISNLNEFGRCANIINSPIINKKEILKNLKDGKSYGIYIYRDDKETMDEKIKLAHNLEKLVYCKTDSTAFSVKFNKTPDEIKFIGQNGEEKNIFNKIDSASYQFKNNDSYIRVIAKFPSGNKIYLNPLIKYNNLYFYEYNIPRINSFESIKSQFLRLIVLSTLIYYLFKIYRKRGKAKQE